MLLLNSLVFYVLCCEICDSSLGALLPAYDDSTLWFRGVNDFHTTKQRNAERKGNTSRKNITLLDEEHYSVHYGTLHA